MFATYSLNIRRLLTQSIRRRPNLHVKSEHHRIIAEYSLAVRGSAFFFRKESNTIREQSKGNNSNIIGTEKHMRRDYIL